MSTIVWNYDKDLSGTNPNNLVSGEVHNIPAVNGRAFATDNGPFYSDSVVVKVKDTGVTLTRGVDYKCLYLYADATAASGKSVTAVIQIVNASVIGDVLVDYQVVGGEFSSNAYALEEAIAALEIDNRAITWINVLNKPAVFPPEPHLHAATDLYGFEYLVDAINDMIQAILLGDTTSHDQIYLRMATIKKQLQDDYNAKIATFNARVTQVENDMDAMNTRLSGQMSALSSVVTNHINNKNNPHGVTTTQISAVPTSRTVNGQSLSQNIVVGTVLPGIVVVWYSNSIPAGWYLCNGQAVNGNDPRLRALVGANVPDFRGYVLRARDGGRGVDSEPNRGLGSIQTDAIQNITGSFGADVASSGNVGVGIGGAFYEGGDLGRVTDGGSAFHGEFRSFQFDASRVVRTAVESRMKNVAVNYIIAGDNATML